jgi:branched-chain amino acid transport system substrate-binding protein
MKKLSKVFVGLTAVVAGFTLASCSAVPGASTNTTGTQIGKTFKLGYDIEMTGAVAAFGKAGERGADMAVSEINADGGINGKKLKSLRKITSLIMQSLRLWLPT